MTYEQQTVHRMQEAEVAATPPTAEKAALEANAPAQGQVGRRLEVLSFKIIKLYKSYKLSFFNMKIKQYDYQLISCWQFIVAKLLSSISHLFHTWENKSIPQIFKKLKNKVQYNVKLKKQKIQLILYFWKYN